MAFLGLRHALSGNPGFRALYGVRDDRNTKEYLNHRVPKVCFRAPSVESGVAGVEWHPYPDSGIPQIAGQPACPGRPSELSGQNPSKIYGWSSASCGAS